MKTVTFKHDSWHYWLADNWGGHWDTHTDICAYSRGVLWGAIKLFGFSMVVLVAYLLVGFGVGDMLAWMVVGFMHGWVDPSVQGGVAFIFLVIGLALALLSGLFIAWSEYGHILTNRLPPRDAFVPEAYRSFKDKVCFRVEIR